MRILVVEDQQDLNEIIARKLTREGYSVDACYTGDDAMEYLHTVEYDAVLMDIMLSGITGLGVLQEMRAAGDKTPVLLLTALGTVEDRIAGLDMGADDYMVKPFDLDELVARIRAITRRSSARASTLLKAGDISVDTASHQVIRDGRQIDLTAKEFAILEYLMENQGRVVSRDIILEHIWNYDYEGASNMVDVYVHHLRKKLGDSADNQTIRTVKGVGYMIK